MDTETGDLDEIGDEAINVFYYDPKEWILKLAASATASKVILEFFTTIQKSGYWNMN